MAKKVDIGNTDENADWIKSLPSYEDEVAIHDVLAKKLKKELEEGGPGSGWFAPPKGTHVGKKGQPKEHREEAIANRLGLGPNEVGFANHVDPGNFSQVLDKHLPKEFHSFVTKYSPEEYREMGAKCFLSESGRSGFALKPDGDIISVFSSPGAKEGRWAMMSAIANGGTKLDCFEGFLSDKFYPQFGFEEYERWEWDDQYAPAGWDYDKYNRPGIILMELGD